MRVCAYTTELVYDKVRIKTELSAYPKPTLMLMLVSHTAYSSFHRDQTVTTRQVLHGRNVEEGCYQEEDNERIRDLRVCFLQSD